MFLVVNVDLLRVSAFLREIILTAYRRRHYFMRIRISNLLLIAFVTASCSFPSLARADVIVLANRTGTPVEAQVATKAAPAQAVTIAADDSLPVFVDGAASVVFASQGQRKQYVLTPNCAYYFGRAADGRIDLQQIGLGEDESTADGRSLPGAAGTAPSATIPVKILVDEEEPARRTYWERRLRHRIEAASKILDKHCRVQLRVVAVDTWNTDNATSDFFKSLAEFEREVDPAPARVAIGFTSQFQLLRGRVHMAGTRGPLHSHILLREFSPKISEPERLEFLVHELGHFLGASHSPESISVMRPVLGDNLAGRSDFAIRFDPVNTLTMSMLGEEIRRRDIRKLADMTAGSKHRLRQIYTHLAKTLPEDPAGGHFIRLMDGALAASASTRGNTNNRAALVAGTKHVLAALSRAAQANQQRRIDALTADDPVSQTASTQGAAAPGDSVKKDNGAALEGDALMDHYVRTAAKAAQKLPADVGPNAFLLALGIAMDDTGALLVVPQAAVIAGAADSPLDRAARVGNFGKPTMHDRQDLAKHFAVSACLTALVGVDGAHQAGMTKEMLDARMTSGFSFVDMAANQSGITFASGVLKKHLTLAMIAASFEVDLVMPNVDDLPEGLSRAELEAQFGGQGDRRFRQQIFDIQRRVLRLPPYRVATSFPSR